MAMGMLLITIPQPIKNAVITDTAVTIIDTAEVRAAADAVMLFITIPIALITATITVQTAGIGVAGNLREPIG